MQFVVYEYIGACITQVIVTGEQGGAVLKCAKQKEERRRFQISHALAGIVDR